MLRRSNRIRDVPQKLKNDFVMFKDNDEEQDFDEESHLAYCLCAGVPNTYEEAVSTRSGWDEAVQKEIDALEKHETWEPAVLPKGTKPIDTRWIFKVKSDGTKKARLVAKGFQEQVSSNIYAPVAQLPTIKILLSVALQKGWHIRQLDIPAAFLNGKLDSEIYIKLPKGVNYPSDILKLKKSLYGLRSAPRKWNERFNGAVEKYGLVRLPNDSCLYKGDEVWLVLWVDDIIITGVKSKCNKLIEFLKEEFQAKDLGIMKSFLGTDIMMNEDSMSISQEEFVRRIINKFGMENCKSANTPMEHNFQIDAAQEVDKSFPYRELVGSLIYVSTVSRPDIAYATSILSRFMDKPTRQLWIAAKRVLRYLKNTQSMCLIFHRQKDSGLITYSDADWAGDITDRKSTSGCVVYHGGNPISWYSRKQDCVSQLTAQSEYIACATAAMDVVYFQRILIDLKSDSKVPLIYVDNQSAIDMSESYENSKRTRHIDIKYHHIKDLISKNLIELQFIKTDKNVADIFTKSLCSVKFLKFRKSLNIS